MFSWPCFQACMKLRLSYPIRYFSMTNGIWEFWERAYFLHIYWWEKENSTNPILFSSFNYSFCYHYSSICLKILAISPSYIAHNYSTINWIVDLPFLVRSKTVLEVSDGWGHLACLVRGPLELLNSTLSSRGFERSQKGKVRRHN